MVKNFNEYNELNEGVTRNIAEWGLIAFLLFNKIGSDTPKRYDIEWFKNYVSNNSVNNNHDIKTAIKNVKNKVMGDNKITNKQDIINTIDSTLVLFNNKNDFVIKNFYKQASKNIGLNPSCFTYFPNDGSPPIIALSNDATLIDIQHEYYHVVEWVMDFDTKGIKNMFDFNGDFKYQNQLYRMLTNYEYKLSHPVGNKELKYLNTPSEIYVRLNNLKLFLYKYNFIKTPNENLGKEIFEQLYTGEIYKNLPNDKIRENFRGSDFMQILIFMKTFNDINKYANMDKKIKNYT